MIRKALRRANRSYVFLTILALLFTAGYVGSTYAYFDGQTALTATYAGGSVAAPTGLTATAGGYDGVLTWTAPSPITTTYTTPTTTFVVTTTPGVQGQRVVLHDNGTTTNCTSVTYDTTVASGLPKTQSTYTDTNRTATTGNGNQFCYAVQTYWTTNSWYQQTTANVAQLGLALQKVQISNSNGTLATNDQIVLTFNQPPATPSTVTICTYQGTGTSGVVFIGDSTCTNKTTDPFQVGKITNVAVGGTANSHQSRSASVSISGNVMTITVGQNGQTVSGTYTWTTSTNLKSAQVTRQATVCTTANTNCTPTVTGTF